MQAPGRWRRANTVEPEALAEAGVPAPADSGAATDRLAAPLHAPADSFAGHAAMDVWMCGLVFHDIVTLRPFGRPVLG